jgi:hypothetical protein
MTLDQIRQYINYICVKENSGGTLTPEQVNVIFPAASIDMYNKTIEKAQLYALQNKMPFSRAIYEFKSMLRFRTKKNISFFNVITGVVNDIDTIRDLLYITKAQWDLFKIGDYVNSPNLPNGIGIIINKPSSGGSYAIAIDHDFTAFGYQTVTLTNYPNTANYNLDTLGDYGYWLSLITNYNSKTKSIDILTDQELDDRRTNSLSLPLDEYPAAIINNNLINIYPNDITSAEFTYLRKSLTPIYDYYIDANANEIYLQPGTSHTLEGGEIGSAGQTSGGVDSNTVELDWDELFHVAFCNEVLSRVGINLKDGMVEQYINQAKQEQG